MSGLPGDRDELVLEVVGEIPRGRLASYGDVAGVVTALGVPCTARQTARALREFGSAVPWWRVVQAAGTLAEPVAARACEQLRAEGVPVQGQRVPLHQLRWVPDTDELAAIAGRIGGGPVPGV
ncbi:MAG: MGMT family protein [Candidatus Nanopelagicales bacterium]|nr:MGMT family protein [Candidatus Nanopelagicales bacterium]MCU0298695.1 MGMT family protein [Candidatus Nanopelagicales bacterium]